MGCWSVPISQCSAPDIALAAAFGLFLIWAFFLVVYFVIEGSAASVGDSLFRMRHYGEEVPALPWTEDHPITSWMTYPIWKPISWIVSKFRDCQ